MVFILSAFLKNLLKLCCLSTFQNKGLKSWCEALWLWHGIDSQASLMGGGAASGLFHGETLKYNCTFTLGYCLLIQNSVSWENIVPPPALGCISCDWHLQTGTGRGHEEGWFLSSVDRHHSVSFFSLIVHPCLPMCLKCSLLKSTLQGYGGVLWAECFCLPNSMWKGIPNVTGFGGGGLWEVITWSPYDGLNALIRRDTESFPLSLPSVTWKHSKMAAICKTALTRNRIGHLDLGLPGLQNCER